MNVPVLTPERRRVMQSLAVAKSPPRHRQVEVHGVWVDELLAPWLQVLWDNGIVTHYSCQGSLSRECGIALETYRVSRYLHLDLAGNVYPRPSGYLVYGSQLDAALGDEVLDTTGWDVTALTWDDEATNALTNHPDWQVCRWHALSDGQPLPLRRKDA